jgi:hypothetical protein
MDKGASGMDTMMPLQEMDTSASGVHFMTMFEEKIIIHGG